MIFVRMWIALILLLLVDTIYTLRIPNFARRSHIPALQLEKGSGSGDDFDSSGMTAMSSSEIKEIKIKQQLRDDKMEEERINAMLRKSFELNTRVRAERAGKSTLTKTTTTTKIPPTSTSVAAPAKDTGVIAFPTVNTATAAKDDDDKQLANFSAGSGAFDLGLLLAFPVIIGTLALFFVFPFVGEKLAGGSGPLPPGM